MKIKFLVVLICAFAFHSPTHATNVDLIESSDLMTDASALESDSDQDLSRDEEPGEAVSKPIAAVYSGPGACPPCIWGAARAARHAGYEVVHVKAKISDLEVLKSATIWVQPGGHSANVIEAVGPEYLKRVHDFVERGGGYVGFCAGGFISTDLDGTTGLHGYNIVAGKTEPIYSDGSPDDHAYIKSLTWNGVKRSIYFNGGPSFDFSGVVDPNLNIVATYDEHDHKVAAFTTKFGKGKIAISGAHPEELGIIKFYRHLRDPDGSDVDLAVEMMQFAKP